MSKEKKILLLLNILVVPALAAIFFHDPKVLTADFSFDINNGWIDLMIVSSLFGIPINIMYCLVLVFKKKEKVILAIKYCLFGLILCLTTGTFVFFWLGGLLATVLG